MKKPLVLALLVALSLTGCAASGPTLSKSDAEDILFTPDDELDDAIVTDEGRADDMDIEDFVDYITDDVDIEFDPEECYNSTFSLLLLDRDSESPAGRVFIGETVTTGVESGKIGGANQWVRWFETPGEAAAFYSQYKKEQAGCTEFTVESESDDIEVEAEVEDADVGDEAFVLKTTASYDNGDDQDGETYVIRSGNVIVMLAGGGNESYQGRALHELVDEMDERLEDAAEGAAR